MHSLELRNLRVEAAEHHDLVGGVCHAVVDEDQHLHQMNLGVDQHLLRHMLVRQDLLADGADIGDLLS